VDGWIKLHRKILDWEWASDPIMMRVWLQLLFDANYEPKRWKGITVDRGQLIFGRIAFAEKCGISERQIRTAMERLKSTNELTIKTTNRFSLVTITKYELYQFADDEATSKTTSQMSNKRPANDQQTTTPKELKKERSKETISLVDSEEKPARKKDDYAWFDELWKAYPRKEGKSGVSNKAKDEIKKTGLDVVMSSIVKYRNKIEGKDPQYTMLGSTFFNGRYKDYIDDTCVEPEAPMPYEVIDDGGGFKLVRRTG